MPGACRQEASVMDPQSEALAEVYAQGLLDCLPADDQAEQAAEQLEGVVGLLESVEGSAGAAEPQGQVVSAAASLGEFSQAS